MTGPMIPVPHYPTFVPSACRTLSPPPDRNQRLPALLRTWGTQAAPAPATAAPATAVRAAAVPAPPRPLTPEASAPPPSDPTPASGPAPARPAARSAPDSAGRPPPRRSPRGGPGDRRRPPDSTAIATLPPFPALDLDQITVVRTSDDLIVVQTILLALPVLGFDTESKPVFQRGVTNDGPHLAQFSAAGQAWLIPLHVDGAIEALARIIGSTRTRKVGFGLDSDLTLLRRRLGQEPQAVHDLDSDFRRYGYRGALGLKSAVAVMLGQRFTKSKRIGTSNWANRTLTADQSRYAANDAWGAYCIHQALDEGKEPIDLPPSLPLSPG